MPLNPAPSGWKTNPRRGSGPVPIWLIFILGVILYVADMYVVDHGGFQGDGFDARVYYPYGSLAEVEDRQPKVALPPGYKEGRNKFEINCAACHGADGGGNAANGYPPVAGSEWVTDPGPNRAIRIVLNGVNGPLDVAGKSFNVDAMLVWRDALGDEDIANILTYLRNTWGNHAPAVTKEQVAAIRKATADRSTKWTAEELKQIAPQ
jgi:mono/diheme cytochrome c family protein